MNATWVVFTDVIVCVTGFRSQLRLFPHVCRKTAMRLLVSAYGNQSVSQHQQAR